MIQPILLVDDEAELRAHLKEALTLDGYRVEDAADANSALAMIEKQHYPVILTDLYMPGGPSGFDLIAAVKARDPQALCVLITGFATMEKAIQAIKFGAYDFVQKPFRIPEIEAVLDRALNHAQVLAELRDYQREMEARVVARVQEARAFHDEVLALNDLLLDAQTAESEAPLLRPFLAHLRTRLGADAAVALLPEAGRWRSAAEEAERPWPAHLDPPFPGGPLEWTWEGGPREGWLLPLGRDADPLGLVFLGFEGRSGFQPHAPHLVLWRRQVEAALLGLRRTRDRVAAEVAAALERAARG